MIEVFNMCGSLPKDYKYTVGERLKNTLMDLMMNIYEANISDDNKAEILGRCKRYVVETKLYLRMLHDLNLLSVRRFAALSDDMEVISRQVTAWHKAQG
jgi:four helix bundle protein